MGFAASAHGDGQLRLLRAWLAGASLPAGLVPGLELRAQILATLSACGLAGAEDLDAFAADDPVGGETHRAACRAMRPDPAAKEAAWTAAVASGQAPRLALAHARGIWMPGQERILRPYRDRYFTEALPAIGRHEFRTARRLAGLLYPAVFADSVTAAATGAALGNGGLSDAVRAVLLEQQVLIGQMMKARALPASSLGP